MLNELGSGSSKDPDMERSAHEAGRGLRGRYPGAAGTDGACEDGVRVRCRLACAEGRYVRVPEYAHLLKRKYGRGKRVELSHRPSGSSGLQQGGLGCVR